MNEYFENIIRCLVKQSLSQKNNEHNYSVFDLDPSQYPERLYRFRTFKKYDLTSLNDDYIWLSEPEQFADPEDARVNIGADANPDIANANNAAMIEAILDRFWDQLQHTPSMQGITKDQFFAMVSENQNMDISYDEIFLKSVMTQKNKE